LKAVLGSGLLNPFLAEGEPQTAEAMAALAAASADGVELYGGTSVTTSVDASVSGGLGFSLPGGEVQLATGVDLRREEYEFGGNAAAEAAACIWHPSTTAISSGTSAATPRRYSPSCTSRCWTAWT
jgi:iron complex outermembrane receptor protein